MGMMILENGTIGAIDPTGHYKNDGAPMDYLQESMGFIPTFLAGGADSMKENLEQGYGSFAGASCYWSNKKQDPHFEVMPNLVYRYCMGEDRDPDLYPIAVFKAEKEVTVIYPYGIVCYFDGTEWHWCRMD